MAIDTATKRYSLIDVLPVPDGAIAGGDKYSFIGEYAGDTWPAPPAGLPIATLELIADNLPTGLALTADNLVSGLAITADNLVASLAVTVDGS